MDDKDNIIIKGLREYNDTYIEQTEEIIQNLIDLSNESFVTHLLETVLE